MASININWEAPEFFYRKKKVSWYWSTIILATILIGIAAWQRNLLFGLFIVIAELLILSWGHREPAMIQFALTDEGLYANEKKLGAYADFESFSHEDRGQEKWQRLSFVFRHRMKPPFKIVLPTERTDEIKASLREIVAEVPHEPTVLESIEELIGF